MKEEKRISIVELQNKIWMKHTQRNSFSIVFVWKVMHTAITSLNKTKHAEVWYLMEYIWDYPSPCVSWTTCHIDL